MPGEEEVRKDKDEQTEEILETPKGGETGEHQTEETQEAQVVEPETPPPSAEETVAETPSSATHKKNIIISKGMMLRLRRCTIRYTMIRRRWKERKKSSGHWKALWLR